MEYLGVLRCELETVESFKKRMVAYQGFYQRGARRKYFFLRVDGSPSDHFGKQQEYSKLSWDELGIPYERIEEYPV